MADPRGGWREKVKINENSSSAGAIEKLPGIPGHLYVCGCLAVQVYVPGFETCRQPYIFFFFFNGFCTSLQNSFIHCYPRFVPFSSILHARAFRPTRFCESDRSHTSHTAPCSPPQPFSCFLDDVASSMPPVDPLYPLSRSSHLDVPLYCMFAITKHCAQLLIFPYNARLISA